MLAPKWGWLRLRSLAGDPRSPRGPEGSAGSKVPDGRRGRLTFCCRALQTDAEGVGVSDPFPWRFRTSRLSTSPSRQGSPLGEQGTPWG